MHDTHESDLALFQRVREDIADYHALLAARSPDDHRAISECACSVAGTYRRVKARVYALRAAQR